jgi:hypothetical protein
MQESLHELAAQACDDDQFLESILLSFVDGDEDLPAMHTQLRDENVAPQTDTRQAKSRVRNKISAQQAREADRVYIDRMLVELQEMSETFQMYVEYIAQLKQQGSCAVESMPDFEECYATIKNKQDMLLKTEIGHSVPTLLGMTTKERNRIHAQKSRKKKELYAQDIIKHRDELWATLQDVMQHTEALEASSKLLNYFDEISNSLLGLTQARDRLFQRTCSHKRQYEELKSRLSYRAIHRLNFKQIMH